MKNSCLLSGNKVIFLSFQMTRTERNKRFIFHLCRCLKVCRGVEHRRHARKAGGYGTQHDIMMSIRACIKCKAFQGEDAGEEFYRKHQECESGLVNDAAFVKLVREEWERREEIAKAVAMVEAVVPSVDLDASLPQSSKRRRLSESDSSVSDLVVEEAEEIGAPVCSSSPSKQVQGGERESVSQQLAHQKLLDRFNDLKANYRRILKERDELRGKVGEIRKLKEENLELKAGREMSAKENGDLRRKVDESQKREGELKARIAELERQNREKEEIANRLSRRCEELGKDREKGDLVESRIREWKKLNEDRYYEFHIPISNSHRDGEVLYTTSLDESIYCYKRDPTKDNCLHATHSSTWNAAVKSHFGK